MTMTPNLEFQRRALQTAIDAAGRVHFQPEAEALECEPLFSQIRRDLLRGRLAPNSTAGLLILCALVFEAVYLPDELRRFLDATDGAARVGDRRIVSWVSADGRRDERELSDATQLVLSRLGRPVDWKSEFERLETWLQGLPHLVRRQSRTPLFVRLMLGCCSWWIRLPGALFCHAARLQPCTAVALSTWAREVSHLALQQQDLEPSAHAGEDALHQCVAAASVPAAATGGWIIDSAQSILSRSPRGRYAEDRQTRIDEICRLIASVEEAGPTASLLLGWALYLLAVGTVRKEQPALSTVGKYFQAVAAALRSALDGRSLFELEAQGLASAYRDAIERSPEPRQTSAGLASLQAYLVEHFGLTPVWIGGHNASQFLTMPAANWCTDGEVDWIDTVLTSTDPASRVHAMARVSLHLALDLPLRISELLSLRLADVQITEEQVLVHIRRHRTGPRLKSESAQRSAVIDSGLVCSLLMSWKSRRYAEGALAEDLLMGDGIDGARLSDARAMYALLNRLLKVASGDSEVSFHTLRHTSISRLMLDAFIDPVAHANLDPLAAVAARAGHASAVTGLTQYFHRFASGLRASIDSMLLSDMHARYVSSLSGVTSAALSQRLHRARTEERARVLTRALQTKASALPGSRIEDQFDLAPPQRPNSSARQLRFIQVIEIITDFSQERTVDQVSLRSGLTSEIVSNVRQQYEELRKLVPSDIKKSQWRQPKFSGLLKRLVRRADDEVARRAAQAWRVCVKQEFLSTSNPAALAHMVDLLYECGLPIARLLLRTTDLHGSSTQQALDVIKRRYSASPQIEGVPARRDRPSLYLLVSSHAGDGVQALPSAAIGMGGFNAIFLCLSIFHAVTTAENRPEPNQEATYVG